MSWENVKAIFPYGLPASLQYSDQWSLHGSNVISFEQWRRHRRGASSKGVRRFEPTSQFPAALMIIAKLNLELAMTTW